MPPARALCRAQQWLRALSAGEIASRLDALRKLPLSEHHLQYDEVSSVWRRFAMQPPNQRPFGAPYFWAAFTFTGA
jgi:CHAT domain-containing protein